MGNDRDRGGPAYEHEVRTVLESLQENVVYYDREMRILWANPAACESASIDLETLRTHRCWEVWAELETPCADCPVIRAMEIGTAQVTEKTTSDGRSWIVKGYPVKQDGEVIGGIETTLEITSRKRTELALAQAYEILNRSPAVGFVWENAAGWPVRYVTPNVSMIFGHSAEEFTKGGLSYEEVVHPDDIARVADEVSTNSADKAQTGFSHLPYRIVTKDGGTRWVSDDTVIDRDADGEPVFYKGIIVDISERVAAEQALDEYHRSLVEAQALTHLGSFKWEIETGDAALSDEMYRIFGLEPGFFSPTFDTFVEALHPADRERVLAAANRAVEDDTPYAEEYRIVRPDGAERFVFAKGQVHRDDEGNPLRMVGSVLDITDTKLAKQDLSEERERLTVTLHSIGDGVITTDRIGRITLLNPVAEELTGWTEAEARGQPLPEVFRIVNEITREPCEDPAALVAERGETVNLTSDTVLIGRDGRESIVADSGAPIRDSDGEMIGVVLVFRDVTQTRRIEEELLKVEKLKSLGVLAGGIAHDFNNYLTAMIGNLSLLKLDVSPTGAIGEMLAEIEKAALLAKNLTQQLLTFSKGGEPIKKLARMDRMVPEAALFTLRGSKTRCLCQLGADLWPTMVDEGQIAQVIHNLLFNADQAMPEGGEIKITGGNVTLTPGEHPALVAGDYVVVTVQDHGTGIKKEHLRRVFDPYFTTKQKGSGLGLAIVFSIVKRHRGHVSVESQLGVGTTFRVHLPASPQAVLETSQPEDTIVYGAGRLLLMDDEDFIRAVATKMLERIGYEVRCASDGAQAVRMYREARTAGEPFAAVILDLTVPGGMGGEETMRELLEIDPDVKAIVSSGYSRDPVMADFRAFGFKAAVKKPYVISEMNQAVQSVVEGQ